VQFLCREVGDRLKINKLKDNSGSAMLLAIFVLTLVTVAIIMFSTSIGNQIKSTMKTDESIEKKYESEGYIEESLGEFIESINVTNVTKTENGITTTIGYKIKYNDSIEDMTVETIFDSSNRLPGKEGISVKPNTYVDFKLTIEKENDEWDSVGEKYKYKEKYKIESIPYEVKMMNYHIKCNT